MTLKLSLLTKAEFVEVVAEAMNLLPHRAREDILYTVITAVMPKTKYRKIESYMERLFERDMALRPLVAASMTMKYMHINPKMKPFIIRTAQRAKDRVRKRIKE